LEGIIGFEIIEGSCDKEKFRDFIFSKVASLHVCSTALLYVS